MELFPLLKDLAAVLSAALVMGFIFFKLKQPVIIGYLVAGLIVGPYGLKFVSDMHTIETFSELGVMLLMFALGVEFSFSELKPVKKLAILGGSAQILLTVGLTTVAAGWFGIALGTGILLGCMIALSSTIIVLKVLMERGEIDSVHGRAILGLLIVQDLSVVIIMTMMPNLGDPAKILGWPMLLALGKAALFLATVVLLGTRLFPVMMKKVASTGNKELFLLSAMILCFGTAAASFLIGLSLALGAFIAGIVVSESDHSHQILADVLPLRDLFATLFFVSVGMLINPGFLVAHLGAVALLVAAIVVGKTLLVFGIARVFGYSGRTSLAIGLGLAQIGEFTFILAKLGQQQGLISASLFSLILTGALVTILITPLLMQAATPMYLGLAKIPWLRRARPAGAKAPLATGDLGGMVDHVVVCGFGRVGSNLGEVLIRHGYPVLVIDTDQNLIQDLRRRGVSCMYGDSSNIEVLKHAQLPLAKLFIAALPDATSCRLAVKNAKQLNPQLDVLARAHRTQDISELYGLGADEVVQPEFEASIEVIRYTLAKLGYTTRELYRYAHQIRQQRYRQFEDTFDPSMVLGLEEALGAADLVWFDVKADSPLSGQSLRSLDLRNLLGLSAIAIRRQGEVVPNPDPDDTLFPGDGLLVMGPQAQLDKLSALTRPPSL
ncbi:MAG TPA: cation:proton antiporter [Pantanalinema sp.]